MKNKHIVHSLKFVHFVVHPPGRGTGETKITVNLATFPPTFNLTGIFLLIAHILTIARSVRHKIKCVLNSL
jgi:hypothetical protein